jgi:ABC-type spermidine/putrescine transport system permease subunit I
LLLPAAILYGGLILGPLGFIFWFSVSNGYRGFMTVLNSPLLRVVVRNTAEISLITTGLAVIFGYILASALWRSRPTTRNLLLVVILLPFWTGVLIKNFAWASLLQDNGTINNLLIVLGLTHGPITLLHNRLAVIIGMVHYVLPYAIFPIYTSMRGIDRRLEQAARSLGAPRREVLRRIVLPLTVPGISSAALLVFIISCGFFITPVILGGPSDMMVANLVDYYVHVTVDFPSASALAMLILFAILPLIVVQQLLQKEHMHGAA